jgi:uridine kinase
MKDLSTGEKNLFWFGLALKLLLGSIFASHFLTELFLPFIHYFILSDFSNPYEFYSSNEIEGINFPYPALMLYVMTFPIFLLSFFQESGLLESKAILMISRIPLIIADIAIFFILRSWIRNKLTLRLIWLYWLSPVLIYINYIHGQLDVIPISLLLVSLHFLFKNKLLVSSAFLALAFSTKTIVALTLPFIFLYLVSKNISLNRIIVYFLMTAAITIFTNLQFLFDLSFQEMVFNNVEQRKILDLSITIADRAILIIPSCLLILLIRASIIKTYNRDIFIMLLGFSFGIILIFVTPMQGWYYWLIPLLAYFYTKSNVGIKGYSLFISLQLFYFVYFIFSPGSTLGEELGLLSSFNFQYYFPEISLNISFTILQTLLAANCFVIYKKGLESYSRQKVTSAPFLIGVGGDSGSGKTFLSDSLQNIFSAENSLSIKGDDVHRWSRGHEKWNEFTHLNPKANLLHREIGMLQNLKRGNKILRSIYNHETGLFDNDKVINPKNLIIYEGLHPFYLDRQRSIYDLKVFLKPQTELANKWKLIRDINLRGHSKESVLKSIEEREHDSKKFIQSQEQYADIVIEAESKKNPNAAQEEGDSNISYKILINKSIFLEPLLEKLKEITTLQVNHSYKETEYQEIILSGSAFSYEIHNLASEMVEGLEDIGVFYPEWPKGTNGVLILMLIYLIFEDLDNAKL